MRRLLKYFIILFSITLFYQVKGQTLSFSPQVTMSIDPDEIEIANLWERYIEEYNKPNDEYLSSGIWHEGGRDRIRYISPNYLIYNMGNQYTFSIRKMTNDIYEINTISLHDIPRHDGKNISNLYRVCAIKNDIGKYELISYFDVVKNNLQRYVSGNIEYYYSSEKYLDLGLVDQTQQFISEFADLYKIQVPEKIIYLLGNSLDECAEYLGFRYTIMRSHKWYAGVSLHPNLIISTRPNHIHEIVHAIIIPLFPQGNPMLQEGIALYHGGGSNQPYHDHLQKLLLFLNQKDLDLNDELNLYQDDHLDEPMRNKVGAMIIDYTLNEYGPEKVLELLKAPTYYDIFKELGVEEEGITDFVYSIAKRYE